VTDSAGDADSLAGQLTLDPSAAGATITPTGCTNTGVTLGSSAGFAQGTVDDVTLVSASGSAATNCLWDITGIGVAQAIPAQAPAGTYTLNLTITVTAN
jgi:hypothetical protein